jgi:hypothetical protein
MPDTPHPNWSLPSGGPRPLLAPRASGIDAQFPVFGTPTTLSVRNNFAFTIQRFQAVENRVSTLESSGGGGGNGGGGLAAPAGPLVSSNGTLLGNITLGTNLTFSGSFPNQVLNAAGGSAANPTATINGPAVNGAAATFMRSDAAPALGTVGVADTYAFPESLTTDAYGRVTAVVAGTGGGGGGGLPLTGGVLGTNANPQTTTASTILQLTGADSGGGINTTLAIDAVGVPVISLRKMLGSMETPNLPGNGNQLGAIEILGWSGTGFGGGAQIQAVTAQAWSTANNGTTLQFMVCPNNSNTRVRAMWIGNAGGLLIGSPNGGDMGPGTLNVQADIYVNGVPLNEYVASLA